MQKSLDNGISVNDSITLLKQSGLTIIESMKTIMEVYGIGLGAAKELTASHPAWGGVVRASETLHDEAEEALQKYSKPS